MALAQGAERGYSCFSRWRRRGTPQVPRRLGYVEAMLSGVVFWLWRSSFCCGVSPSVRVSPGARQRAVPTAGVVAVELVGLLGRFAAAVPVARRDVASYDERFAASVGGVP